ncbi:MAG: fumarylacetoacetate hydrolase family protein [Saprospiraceae bacterium]|nr:fumarylacetoacetate hydrolase family protein [Saprospiraceae bacterium]
MKIICIGRNYRDHAKELNNPVPTKPLVFMKPPSALLIKNKPMYIPDFTKNLHFEAEIVLKICKNGKYVQPAFAKKYFKEIAFGIDFTARDIQDQCKAKGHPWEIAKAFDNSAALSEFISLENVNQEEGIKFQMKKNGEVVQDGNTKDLIFDFNFLICYVSKFFKLQMGDMIFTGTPAGVGPVEIGDHLEGFVDGEKLMDCQIR